MINLPRRVVKRSSFSGGTAAQHCQLWFRKQIPIQATYSVPAESLAFFSCSVVENQPISPVTPEDEWECISAKDCLCFGNYEISYCEIRHRFCKTTSDVDQSPSFYFALVSKRRFGKASLQALVEQFFSSTRSTRKKGKAYSPIPINFDWSLYSGINREV